MFSSREFVLETQTMPGVLGDKLKAMLEFGFQRMVLDTHDLISHPQGVEHALNQVIHSQLHVCAIRLLKEVAGLAHESNGYRTGLVKNQLEMCQRLNSSLLLVGVSDGTLIQDKSFASDLRKLAMMALPFNIKIAVQTPFTPVSDLMQSFDILCEADFPNLGMALNFPSWMQSGAIAEDLDMLDVDQVFLVQMSDCLTCPPSHTSSERKFFGKQVMPGLGNYGHDISAFLLHLQSLRYKGLISLCAQHSDQNTVSADCLAKMAQQSASWLENEVMRRPVSFPSWVTRSR